MWGRSSSRQHWTSRTRRFRLTTPSRTWNFLTTSSWCWSDVVRRSSSTVSVGSESLPSSDVHPTSRQSSDFRGLVENSRRCTSRRRISATTIRLESVMLSGLRARGQGQGLRAPGQGQRLVIRGQGQGHGLEVWGQGLVNWSSRTRTRTFLEDNNTGLQWRMAYLLTYISK